jgi:protein gp37
MAALALTSEETRQLATCEQVIERGLATYLEVGQALLTIRDNRLYRRTHGTFEAYCRERWGWSKSHANRQIEAARVADEMTPIGVAPTTESQARELTRVEPERRAEVWQATIEQTNGKPTAAAVRQIARERREERSETPRPEAPLLTLPTHTGDLVPYPAPKSRAMFNQTQGDGISWAKWSWNPVTGCLHGCVYCYAREIATSERYKASFPAGFTPLFHEERLDAPANTTIPAEHRDDPAWRRVFVCSMADLYGRWVPDEWIGQVHSAMLASPQWQYILLTKFPARYVGLELPPGAWVGTSVDEQKRVRIAEDAFRRINDVKVKWLSLEPLREPLEFTDLSMFDWVVIGAQTETHQPDGYVPAFAPPFEWVARIFMQAREAGCQVHLKPNLSRSPGMQFPDEYPSDRS